MIYETMKVYQTSGEPLIINSIDFNPCIHSTSKGTPPKMSNAASSLSSDRGAGRSESGSGSGGSDNKKPSGIFSGSSGGDTESSKEAKTAEVKKKSKKSTKKSRVKG